MPAAAMAYDKVEIGFLVCLLLRNCPPRSPPSTQCDNLASISYKCHKGPVSAIELLLPSCRKRLTSWATTGHAAGAD